MTAYCPVCHSSSSQLYQDISDNLYSAPGKWNYLRCTNCEHTWLDPMPTPDEIAAFYQHYHTHYPPSPPRQRLKDRLHAAVLGAQFRYPQTGLHFWGKMLARLPYYRSTALRKVHHLEFVPEGKLLDVGCGNGSFLKHMEALGWTPFGVELDPGAATQAQKEFGDAIHCGSLEDHPFPQESFDAITLNHVLEHLVDPEKTIRECFRLLKPAGRLAVITPNGSSLCHGRFGHAWRGLEPPRHTTIFSRISLEKMLATEKFTTQHQQTFSQGARWMWIKSRMIQESGYLKDDQPKKVSLYHRVRGRVFQTWSMLMSQLGTTGEELFILARKES